jgi:hypothetical protein
MMTVEGWDGTPPTTVNWSEDSSMFAVTAAPIALRNPSVGHPMTEQGADPV